MFESGFLVPLSDSLETSFVSSLFQYCGYIDFITPYIDFIFCLSIVVCLYIYVCVEYVPTHICNPLLRNCVFSLFCFCLVK